jgi:hypothetical protein
MKIKCKMKPASTIIKERGLQKGGPIELLIAQEAQRYCEPYAPKDLGNLIKTSKATPGQLTYTVPYARRWYYTPAHFQGAPMRGCYWFERMKSGGGTQRILKTVAAQCGGKTK